MTPTPDRERRYQALMSAFEVCHKADQEAKAAISRFYAIKSDHTRTNEALALVPVFTTVPAQARIDYANKWLQLAEIEPGQEQDAQASLQHWTDNYKWWADIEQQYLKQLAR